jgi:hypothetical protein
MNIGKGRLKSKVEPGFQPEGEASKELLADIQPSSRDTGGTPVILFARPQRHARTGVQGIKT